MVQWDNFKLLRGFSYKRIIIYDILHGLVGPPGTHQVFFYWNDRKTIKTLSYNSWKYFNNEAIIVEYMKILDQYNSVPTLLLQWMVL